MSRLRQDERGMVLVVAMLVIVTTLALGLATFAFTQDQQRQSGNERVKESAFNLAESALNSATNYLSTNWPTSTSIYPSCTETGGAGCPDASTVASGFSSTDYNSAPDWATNVYDNGAPTTAFFKTGTTDSQPSYDANADGAVWVRASATARGKTRTVVALVKQQPISEIIPHNVLTTNSLFMSAPQDLVYIDERGYAATPSQVALRCTQAGPPSLEGTSSTCAYWMPPVQIQPGAYSLGNTGNACPDATLRCALTDKEMDRLRQAAKAQGNYIGGTTCPTNAQINQPGIVFVEGCSNTAINNAGTIHSQASPGVLVTYQGFITFAGTNPPSKFYGLLYAGNRTNNGAGCVTIGVVDVVGAIVGDYGCRVQVGSQITSTRHTRLVYDPNVFNLLSTVGAVSITPGTFREL
jgi:Tfp pilus assembly protein PilX